MSALQAERGRVLDGHPVARAVRAQIRDDLDRWGEGSRPGLAVVTLSADAASHAYAESKRKACLELGMRCAIHDLSDVSTDAGEVERRVRAIAADPDVHGLMIERPLPVGIDEIALYGCIPAQKDVEGIGCANMGRLMLGQPLMVASTAAAVMRILAHYDIALAGRRAVVVGRSNIVGKPLAALLLAEDATVTVCHSRTPDLAAETLRADVLVAAVGRPRVIGPAHVRAGAVVIDVGINFVDGRMVGDVDFEAVRDRAAAITPVPGGVGPVTTALLLSNLFRAARHQRDS